MERDYDKEIDALKEQMQNLQNRVSSQLDELRTVITKGNYHEASSKKLERVHVMQEMHPDKRLSEQMKELCCETEERGVSGLVTYLGVYTSGGRQSNWIRNAVSVDDLLSLIDEGVAGKVLACVGNESRLTILLEILRGPKTVAELVEKCHFGSTGQVYHHMKPLLAADIIVEDKQQKGLYIVQPHRVQGIVMLLAGISDMVDETYTQGIWKTDEVSER